MSNGKVVIICLIVELIKKISLHKMLYFPEPFSCTLNQIKVKWNLTDYATKFDLKKATGVDKSTIAVKSDLASLNAEVDKIDADNENLFLLV